MFFHRQYTLYFRNFDLYVANVAKHVVLFNNT